MKKLFVLFFFFGIVQLFAQEQQMELTTPDQYYQYDLDFLPVAFHQAKRDSLRKLLPDSSAAVFFASPERNRSNDVYYEYHQDPNFYYLTGFREPNAMLILYKEKQLLDGVSTNEVLFVPKRDPTSELWNGRRLGKEGAKSKLGVNTIKLNADFLTFDPQFSTLKKVFFLPPYALENQDTSTSDNLSGLFSKFNQLTKDHPNRQKKLLGLMMSQLRQIKTSEEIELLKKAIEITCIAQNELMQQITPEMTEYQTEAIIEYQFKKNGAEYPGFPSIQGSGENSCILHYTTNRRPLIRGGLLVSDVGAEYRGYTADVTRTIPPSGKFSKEEKIIYEIVLKAQQAGIDSAKVGNSFWAPHQTAQKIIAQELKKLGIIKSEKEVRTYFMHGTSHYLGLDVHDAGLYSPLQANNVITVEPGIYIAENSDCDPRWWNIGVRIEDDILITEEGPIVLSDSSPRTVEEIENLMQKQ